MQRQIQEYTTEDGRVPFREWLISLDAPAHARILVRLDRVRQGNFGDCVGVGAGVRELRIHYGPGYRVYCGQVGLKVILLLCGGDKRTQARDIQMAQAYWQDYTRRNPHGSK